MRTTLDLTKAFVAPELEEMGTEYTDVVEGMLYANAAMLIYFVEEERGGVDKIEDVQWLIEKDDKDNPVSVGNIIQANNDIEIVRLYKWWKYRRIELLAKKNQILTAWSHFKCFNRKEGFVEAFNSPDSEQAKDAWDRLGEIDALYELECDDFLNSLIRIRRCLWT